MFVGSTRNNPTKMNTEVTIREEFQQQAARFDEYQITSMAEDMDVSASRHNGCVITSEDGDATIEATVFFKKSANTYCYGGFVMTEGNVDEQPALAELMNKLNA